MYLNITYRGLVFRITPVFINGYMACELHMDGKLINTFASVTYAVHNITRCMQGWEEIIKRG